MAQNTTDILNMLEKLGESEDSLAVAPATSSSHDTSAFPSTTADDDFSDIQNLLQRPATPRMTSTATSTLTRSPAKNTPPSTNSNRSSGEQASYNNPTRKSGENAASFNQTTSSTVVETVDTANEKSNDTQDGASKGGGGSSWWGGLSAIANAAVKQAEAAVKEIQKNEEAQKWAEQMKDNYGALRGLGGELRSRALPTFTSILHTLAPPISQHERLQIHITHDLIDYPSLDPLIYQTFSRVMAQVEGGDLMVIQRGSEFSQRRTSEAGYTGSGVSGWDDGPWWRQNDTNRTIGAVKGLTEGTKLVKASAEAYANDFFASRGGIEEAAKQATAVLNESNPVRSSNIFLAIQAINYLVPEEYYGGKTEQHQSDSSIVDEPTQPDELITFAIYLHDPIHSIRFSMLSQSFPQRWADWLDAKASQSILDGTQSVPQLPDEILDMIQSGGVDPREWVSEWMEETLSLAVGVVAQRYVARRMGVGEGGIGRGKGRQETVVESGAGEAARAI